MSSYIDGLPPAGSIQGNDYVPLTRAGVDMSGRGNAVYRPSLRYYRLTDYLTDNQINGVTDSTADFQTLMLAIQALIRANTAFAFVIDFTDCTLKWDGVFQDPGVTGRNSQIVMPIVNGSVHPVQAGTITLMSQTPPLPAVSPVVGNNLQWPASTGRIRGTRTGTGALIGVSSDGGWPFSSIGVHIQNLIIEVAKNAGGSAGCSGIDLRYANCVTTQNVFATPGTLDIDTLTTVPDVGTVGIRFPTTGNGVTCHAGRPTEALGFEKAFTGGEHLGGYLTAWMCKWALDFPELANLPVRLERLQMFECPRGISATGGVYLDIGGMDIEHMTAGHGAPAWVLPVCDVDDPGNVIKGSAVGIVQDAYTGTISSPTKNGGTNFFLYDCGTRMAKYSEISGGGDTSCSVKNSVDLAVATGVYTDPNLDTEIYDSAAMHFTSTAALTGTVSTGAGSPTINGVGTSFLTQCPVGQVLRIPLAAADGINPAIVVVINVVSDFVMTVAAQSQPGSTVVGATATKVNAAIVAPLAGKYDVKSSFLFRSQAGAFTIRTSVSKNGDNHVAAQILMQSMMRSSDVSCFPTISSDLDVQMDQWDYLLFQVWQNTGGNLDLIADNTLVSMRKV